MKCSAFSSWRRAGAISVGALAVVLTGSPAQGQEAKPPEKKGWETVANAGLTLTKGNSENLLASIGINSSRKWSKDEVFLGASAGYGNTTIKQAGQPDNEETTEQYVKGFSQYNHLFTERLYGGLRLDGLYDKIANIHYRFTLSPLLGYYFIKNPNTLLSAEVGPSLVTEEVVSRFTGLPNLDKRVDQNTYVALRVGQRFEHKFKGGAKIWETAEWIPQVTDFENWLLNVEIGASAPLTKKLDVRLVLQDSYDNVPPNGREENDLKLIAGLGYKF